MRGRTSCAAVFDLRVGDVGVAVNQPQTIAYVVRITTSEPPLQVLRDMFLADKMNFGYMSIAREEDGAAAAGLDRRVQPGCQARLGPPAGRRADGHGISRLRPQASRERRRTFVRCEPRAGLIYRCGLKMTTDSGGNTISAENGRPCQGRSSAIMPEALPTLLPA